MNLLILLLFAAFVIFVFVAVLVIIKYKNIKETNKFLLSIYRKINRKVFALDRNFELFYNDKITIDGLSELVIELDYLVKDVENSLERFY